MSAAAAFGKRKMEYLYLKDLSVVWAAAQRPFDDAHAKNIADNFDPDKFGVLAVTLPNGNGVYHIIDGQHRKSGAQTALGENQRVPCEIYETMDQARAAEIFDEVNSSRKKPQPVDLFRVRVTAGRETETAVNKIVRKVGYKIGTSSGDKTISAVAALVSVYKAYGPGVLEDTLALVHDTWGHDKNATVAPIIRGFGAFVAEHGIHADYGRVKKTLAKKFTPGRFIAAAKTAHEMLRQNLTNAVKEVIVNTYNHGLSTGKLEKKN